MNTETCLAAPEKEQLRTQLFFGRVAMTQSWELNTFLTCHSSTKKGSEKFRARGNTAADCPDGGCEGTSVTITHLNHRKVLVLSPLAAFTRVLRGGHAWGAPCEALGLQ